MGSLYRSHEMTYCQILASPEAIYNVVAALGEHCMVQFKDLKENASAYSRTFYNEVRRCEEMERSLHYLISEMSKEGIVPVEFDEDLLLTPDVRDMMEMEKTFEKMRHDVAEGAANWEVMTNRYFDTVEQLDILNKADEFLSEAEDFFHPDAERRQSGYAAGHYVTKLTSIAGVILTPLLPTFERLLWRVCQGNVFIKHETISFGLFHPRDDGESDYMEQSAFLIFFQGERLEKKVQKICDSFHATIYPCPENLIDRQDKKDELAKMIQDNITVLLYSQNQLKTLLLNAAENVNMWLCKVRKMKAVYHHLNMFYVDVNRDCFVGEYWVPTKFIDKTNAVILASAKLASAEMDPIVTVVETDDVPPTFHETNKFTQVFQTIIDAYGMATYREINPAPYAIVSFPFLFSLMFGDAGHGALLVLAALAMVTFEKRFMKKKSRNEIWNMFFGGRYIILLMGLFSVYSGFMYNDIFSKSANIFGSAWFPARYHYTSGVLGEEELLQLSPNYRYDVIDSGDYSGTPYPFGMDPIWQLAQNKITWLNTYKMKMSVIIGVCQMMYGNFLNLLNHIYFRDLLSIMFEFIPMVLFLVAMFGYLDFLIIFKWILFNGKLSQCAPSILITLINMFLGNQGTCETAYFYPYQNIIELVLVLVILVSAICILVPKPIILIVRNKKFVKKLNLAKVRGDMELVAELIKKNKPKRQNVHAHTEFHVGDVVIHQAIHTIEYCLGCISHTASYLRLWALSLAHAELSEVLWHFFMQMPMSMHGINQIRWIVLFCAWAIWAVLTVAILLLMEGLSAFLHTLRLHWVEFQSKFYEGDGRAFEPFCFKTVLEQARAND